MLLQVEGSQGAYISQALHILCEVAHKLGDSKGTLWQGEVQDEGREKNAGHLLQEQQCL